MMRRPLCKQMRESMQLKLCQCSCTHPMSRFATLPSSELVLQPYSKKFALFFHVFLKNASFCSVFSAFILKIQFFAVFQRSHPQNSQFLQCFQGSVVSLRIESCLAKASMDTARKHRATTSLRNRTKIILKKRNRLRQFCAIPQK